MNYLVSIKAYVLIKHEENFHVVKGAGDNTDELSKLFNKTEDKVEKKPTESLSFL